MRTPRKHFHKGFEIRNIPQGRRPCFHILREDFSVTATTSLHSAKLLIDVWGDDRRCACGEFHLPYDHRCHKCLTKGVTHESRL